MRVAGQVPTARQVRAWAAELDRVHERIAGRFARSEPRRRARAYLHGLIGQVGRRNGWQLAEHAGETTPDGMQRLLNGSLWDAELVRDDLRDYVAERLGEPGGVLVVDETGFVKKGLRSAGVQRQYTGTSGKIDNCQVGVFLAYTGSRGSALIDRALYLPEGWTQDPERCQDARIPPEACEFATKPQLAQGMLERALDAGMPAAWVTADEVYGTSGGLRAWLHERAQAYVLAVAVTHQAPLSGNRPTPARLLAAELPAEQWVPISAGAGSNGRRLYDWARLPVDDPTLPEQLAGWLLLRRNQTSGELAAYRCAAPAGTPLAELVRVAGARWTIECCFQQAKGQVGLDEYEVRTWTGWHRHITLAMLAHAALAVIAATCATTGKGGISSRSSSPPPGS